jgi:hypothetical protein
MIRALAFLALVLPVQAGAQEVRSLYTTHDWQTDCTAPDTDRPADEAGMGGRLVCPGPAGLSLMLAEGDARVSMDYGSTRRFGPWESFTSFNSVHETVEWRQHGTGGAARIGATIQRWFVGPDPDPREILVISSVARGAGDESCMVGIVDASPTAGANALARAVADARADGFRCGEDRVRAYGDVGLDTPLPRRAAPSPADRDH